MFLSKHSNGTYYLFYSDERGKRKRVSTRSKLKSDAYKFLQAFKREAFERQQKAKKKLLLEFYKEFLVYAQGNLSKGTIRIYKAAINNFASIIGDLPLSSYTPQHFDIYKAVRLKSFKIIRIKGGHKLDKENIVKPITINIELRTLRAFFNTAVRWRILNRTPFDVKLVSVPKSQPTFLTKEDFQKLLSIIKEGWFKEVIVFAVTTGLRRAELTNLRWSNVDLQRKLLKIESSPTFHTKSGRRRVIPLSETACYLLGRKQYQAQTDYVFTLNGSKIHDNWITHLFKRYSRAAQFTNQKIHFHSLRHTFASWLAQDGVSVYVIKDFLGHSDVKTTQIYSHLQPENLHSEVNKISVSLN